jgi:hypothetical protein
MAMNDNKENQLLELVNSSGYPLQIGIEKLIQQTCPNHHWLIVGREHYWRNNKIDKEGFIDLILHRNNLRMVIECKRVLDKDWIFLVADTQQPTAYKVKLLYSSIQYENPNYVWKDFDLCPVTYESQFCILGKEKDRPSLESVSSDLLLATESLAIEEESILLPRNISNSLYITYIPIIITTANLHICSFQPSNVSMKDGKVPPDSKFVNVDFVRFRKGLATASIDNLKDVQDLHESNKLNERTIFIVSANKILNFFQQFEDW